MWGNMYVDWAEVNERRIGEKTQEIRLYCAQKRQDMTPRAFDLARLSFKRLLDNIAERTPKVNYAVKAVRESLTTQDACIAVCSEKHAAALARGVVYNYIGDDLDLYPITAEKKLLRAKVKQQKECNISFDEMTTQDIIYVVSAITEGENFSKTTMRVAFEWFQQIGLTPIQARLFSVLFMKRVAVSIKSIPQHDLFAAEYRIAAKALIEKGFIVETQKDMYCVTETSLA